MSKKKPISKKKSVSKKKADPKKASSEVKSEETEGVVEPEKEPKPEKESKPKKVKTKPMHKAPRDGSEIEVTMTDGSTGAVYWSDKSWRHADSKEKLSAELIEGWHK